MMKRWYFTNWFLLVWFWFFLKPGKEYTSGKEDEIEAITSNPEQKPQLLQGKQV